MKQALRSKILAHNIEEHDLEAHYYDRIHTEIYNGHEQARIQRSLAKLFSGIPKDAKILDVGAGTGNITRKLESMGYHNITVVDISKAMLRELSRTCSPKHTYCQDIDSFLERSHNRFDVIVLSSVLHHLPDYHKTLHRLAERADIIFATHEPLRRRQGLVPYLLERIDFCLYAARYVSLIILGKLRYLKRDCTYSDYHTGEKAIDPQAITLQQHTITIRTYAVARFMWSAWLLQRLGVHNNFELTIRKKQ
jgi:2-polyprenyl-3-methyl-5-hydroxy-6-metoxy-1,4-benzoquinol methylase